MKAFWYYSGIGVLGAILAGFTVLSYKLSIAESFVVGQLITSILLVMGAVVKWIYLKK
jgi:hypothetical protein